MRKIKTAVIKTQDPEGGADTLYYQTVPFNQ